jgi:hypothetical protein
MEKLENVQTPTAEPVEAKRSFILTKRDGTEIPCRIPDHFTVADATELLAQRAGFEPSGKENELSYRLAVGSTDGLQLLPEDRSFGELPEGLKFKVIPSLAPAA